MSLFTSLKNILRSTSEKISKGVEEIFHKNFIDETSLEQFEYFLLSSDLGLFLTEKIICNVKTKKFLPDSMILEVKSVIAEEIFNILNEIPTNELNIQKDSLNVILMCGVNGNGKTTTTGKLAHYYIQDNKKVMIAACDTFRAGAVNQIQQIAKNINCNLFSNDRIKDPGGIAYEATKLAVENKYDILFMDTAGRLNNNVNLMAELSKIEKATRKAHQPVNIINLLTIDGATGRNGAVQVESFAKYIKIDGIIVTKIDGTAKGGAIVDIVHKFKIPICFIGLGEKMTDIEKFDAQKFANAIIAE